MEKLLKILNFSKKERYRSKVSRKFKREDLQMIMFDKKMRGKQLKRLKKES